MTLLHWAAYYKQLDTVKLLIQFGASVDLKDCKGKTALDLAKDQKADKAVLDLLGTPNKRSSLRV